MYVIVQFLKKKNHPFKLLCDCFMNEDVEIKLSAERFLVNKWLFVKTDEHFRLVQARFVHYYEGYILREFRSFAFKSQ